MSLLLAIWEYVVAMWTDWVSRMSGVASLIISFLAAYYELKDKGKPALWMAAAACYLITSFAVWYKTRPDLSVELQGTWLQFNGYSFPSIDPVAYLIVVKLLLVNTRPANNAIKQYKLTVETALRPHEGSVVRVNKLRWLRAGGGVANLEQAKYSPLVQGQPVEGCVCFEVGELDAEEMKGRHFVLTVTDAYNVSRRIKGSVPEQDGKVVDQPSVYDQAYRS